VWESTVVAVVTAVVTVSATELARFLRARAADKRRSADWEVNFLPKDRAIPGRIAVIRNSGDADAFDVDLTITGDAKFELHPDASLDRCRPDDVFMVYLTRGGTGLFRIRWNDARGNAMGPVDRLPPA